MTDTKETSSPEKFTGDSKKQPDSADISAAPAKPGAAATSPATAQATGPAETQGLSSLASPSGDPAAVVADTGSADEAPAPASPKKVLSRKKRAAARIPATVLRPAKAPIIAKMRVHEKDVGSSQVQIGLMSARIDHLTAHLKFHPKDLHTMRGLVRLVNKRRKLLNFMNRTNPSNYRRILQEFNLRR